jgi:hypothetical protein
MDQPYEVNIVKNSAGMWIPTYVDGSGIRRYVFAAFEGGDNSVLAAMLTARLAAELSKMEANPDSYSDEDIARVRKSLDTMMSCARTDLESPKLTQAIDDKFDELFGFKP